MGSHHFDEPFKDNPQTGRKVNLNQHEEFRNRRPGGATYSLVGGSRNYRFSFTYIDDVRSTMK